MLLWRKNQKIWEFDEEVISPKADVTVESEEFPFPSTVNTSFKSENVVGKNDDGTYYLDISNWFNHITWDELDYQNRVLDFYPDFLGQDSYTYFIKLDKNVELQTELENQVIENKFGKLHMDIKQVQPNTIQVSSYFATENEKVDANDIQEVKEIYEQIASLNDTKLILSVKE